MIRLLLKVGLSYGPRYSWRTPPSRGHRLPNLPCCPRKQMNGLMLGNTKSQSISPRQVHAAGAQMPNGAGDPEQGAKDAGLPVQPGTGGQLDNCSPRCDTVVAVPQSLIFSAIPEAGEETRPADLDSPSCAKHAYLVRYSFWLQASEDPTGGCPYCPQDQENDESVVTRISELVCRKLGEVTDAHVQMGLNRLVTALTIRDPWIRRGLRRKGCFSLLAGSLPRFSSDRTVVGAGLDALLTLTVNIAEETECLGEVQDYLSIFEVLIGFITDRSIMLKTMAVVASLCRSRLSCHVLTEHCRVVECVCTVMECCLDDCNTQLCALKSLNSLVTAGYGFAIMLENCIITIIKAWMLHILRQPIQMECCQLVTAVCGDADVADTLDEYGALKRAAEAMSTHWDDKAIQLLACRLVVRFGEMSESCLVTMSRLKMSSLICKMLKLHGRDKQVQRTGMEGLRTLTSGGSRAASQQRDKIRQLGALCLLPSFITSLSFGDRDGQLLCLQTALNVIHRCPLNAERLVGLDMVWAVSLAMNRFAEDEEVQALGEQLLRAFNAERLVTSELQSRMTQTVMRDTTADVTQNGDRTSTSTWGSTTSGEGPNATNFFADGLATITRLGLYGDDPRFKPKTPLMIGHLSSLPPSVAAYPHHSAPIPNFPAAPAVLFTTQPNKGADRPFRSPSPSFSEPTSVQNRDTDTGTYTTSSPPLTAKGLSDRLTATRAALSKSGNVSLSLMTMDNLEIHRQQQMVLQATAGGGGQGTGGAQTLFASGTGTIGGGSTLNMLGPEAGGFNYSMADTGQNLPFVLSSHNAALLEEAPELFSGGGHTRHHSLAHITPLTPNAQLPDALSEVDPTSLAASMNSAVTEPSKDEPLFKEEQFTNARRASLALSGVPMFKAPDNVLSPVVSIGRPNSVLISQASTAAMLAKLQEMEGA